MDEDTPVESQEEIRIEAPREPEVDPIHYRDVESLIFRGFLVAPAEINGVQFLFKSLNHHEFEYLQWVSSGKTTERYYSTFVAYGVFMVDGQNVLMDRDRWVPEIEGAIDKLPPAARAKIVRNLSEVNRRASNAVVLAEAYQMERVSRFRWAQYRGLQLMDSASTGVLGSERLGMNYAQLVWRALNHYEDLREQSEREWENAKFIGSCFAGKEIRKIYSQDKDRRQKEQEERVQRKDQLIRQVLLGEDPSKDKTQGQVKLIVPRTVEELAAQLESDLRGERDWHDEVVFREEEKMRSQLQERETRLRELQAARDSALEPIAYTRTDLSKGLSPDEVRERVLRGRQIEAQRAASRIVHPEMHDEKLNTFLQKYLPTEESPVPASSTGDRNPTHVQPVVPPSRPPGVPFRR